MSTAGHTLEEHVAPQKATVRACRAVLDDAKGLLSELQAIASDHPQFTLAVRQRPDIELAVHVAETAAREADIALTHAYDEGRQQILDRERPALAGLVKDVDTTLTAFLRAVKRLDEGRDTLVEQLGGAANRLPVVTWPHAADRAESWRSAMRSEHLL